MRFKWIKVGLGGLIAVIFALLNVSALQSAQASTLQDGTYDNITVNMFRDVNGSMTSKTSDAAKFFVQTGGAIKTSVTIKDGTYQATIPIEKEAQGFVTGATANGSNVLNNGSLSLSYPAPSTAIKVTFDLTTPMGKMTQYAWFSLDLSSVPTVSEPASTGDASSDTNGSNSATTNDSNATKNDNSTANTPVTNSSSSSTSSNSSSNTAKSQSSTTASSTTAPTKATTAKTATTKATATKAALTTDGWTYEVLQADNNKVSAANKFYTHAAKITKVGNQYQVQLTVKYAKNSGMQARGFKPLTTNGQAAQNVHYSTSGNDYVVTYTFNVNKLSELTHLITGTVHVAVPTVGINQDFTVRFKFSHQGSATTATNAAKATPNAVSHHVTTNGTADDTTNNSRRGNLPQTNDRPAILATVFGLITLLAVSGAVMISKKVAK